MDKDRKPSLLPDWRTELLQNALPGGPQWDISGRTLLDSGLAGFEGKCEDAAYRYELAHRDWFHGLQPELLSESKWRNSRSPFVLAAYMVR